MQFLDRGMIADDEGDDTDDCACDLELAEDEAVTDAELPQAVGGVEAFADAPADDEDHDGCEIDMSTVEPTTDAELPVAVGGL